MNEQKGKAAEWLVRTGDFLGNRKRHLISRRVVVFILMIALFSMEIGAGCVFADTKETGNEAKIGSTEYATLREAVEAATGGTNDNPVCIEILSDITLDRTIIVNDKRIKLVSEGNYVISRASNMKDSLFYVYAGSMLALGDVKGMKGVILIDGGAIWTGEVNPVLGRGTVNTGMVSEYPLFMVEGEMNIASGVIIQNNFCDFNTLSNARDSGGAIYVLYSGTLNIAGGVIRNNYNCLSGGAIKSNGKITMTGGEIYGNDAKRHGGAIQILGVDENTPSIFEMSGGVIKNNHCNRYGGGLTVSDNSKFQMSSNAMIINNSTEGENNTPGGGVAFADRGTSMTVSGNVKIFGNTRAGTNDNLHIGSNSCNVLKITDIGSEAKIGVTHKNGTGVFGEVLQAAAKDRFFSDSNLYDVAFGENKLSLSQAPLKITGQPKAPNYPDENIISVSVESSKDVSCKWYTWHEDGSIEEASGIANMQSYNIPKNLPEGEHFYFCVATDADGNSATSNIVKIKAPAIYYTIDFNSNGGEGSMKSVLVKAGAVYILPACGFTAPSGKKFKGWAVGSIDATAAGAGESCDFDGNTTVYAVWENIKTDADKVAEVKTIVEEVLAGITAGNETTKADIQSKIDAALSKAGITDVTVVAGELTKKEATSSETGSIKGEVTIQSGSASDKAVINKTIAKLLKTDAEKVAEAKALVEEVLAGITAGNETTKADIQSKIDAALSKAGITGVTAVVGELEKKEATSSEAGSIKGEVAIQSGSAADKAIINKTIAKLLKTDAEKIADVKKAVEKAVTELEVSNSTTAEDFQKAIEKVLEGTDVLTAVKDFKLVEAEPGKEGSIQGTVELTCGAAADTVAIDHKISAGATTPPHTHEYSKEWKKDGNSHWHECGCGEKADITAHTEDSGTITREATATETGIKTYACTVCKAVMRTETIPATGGNTPVSGDVIVVAPVIADGAPRVDFASPADEVKKVVSLTKEEQTAVANGANVNVWLEIKPVTPSENEKNLIEAKKGDFTIGVYVDASMFKKVGENRPVSISQLDRKIKVSIVIPENLQNTDSSIQRAYQIIHHHGTEAEAEILTGTYDEKTFTITFETDQFSTYAVAYKDSKKTSGDGDGDKDKPGDNGDGDKDKPGDNGNGDNDKPGDNGGGETKPGNNGNNNGGNEEIKPGNNGSNDGGKNPGSNGSSNTPDNTKNNNSQTDTSRKVQVPKTGDSGIPAVWLWVLALSGTGVIYFGRKKEMRGKNEV